MTFTPLHQAIGAEHGPITSEMLDELIAQGVEEGDELDFKKVPPEQKALAQSDLAKDIAAFANSGGGVLVFGIAEESRKAAARVDVGEITEAYERTLRSLAVSHIHPPVFGLDVIHVADGNQRALLVVVPGSLDAPHLIYRNDFFGAPIRNHADTVWMRERQIEQMYRARFDARSRADRAIDALYEEIAAGRDTDDRAWLIAVAAPRLPRVGRQPDRDVARAVVTAARAAAPKIASAKWVHPFDSVDHLNPHRGMRRWILRNAKASERMDWCEAWISILDDGAVTLAMAVGGYPEPNSGDQHVTGNEVYGRTVECCVADLMALVGEVGQGEYDLVLGIEWTGDGPLLITTFSQFDFRYPDNSIPLARFTRLQVSVRTDLGLDELRRQAYEIALDAVNQGGVQNVQLIPDPDAT